MLVYSNVVPNDLEAMIALYEKHLNAGRGIREYLSKGFEMEHYAGVKCMDDDVMAGVFSARPGVYFTYDHAELVEEIKRGWPDHIYTGDMLVIEDAYRAHGIAHRVTRGCCDLVKAMGGRHLLVELWVKPDGDKPAGGVIKDMGTGIFEKEWFFPDFYKDLHLYGMTCPHCGDGPCACGAAVGVIRL